MAKSCLLKLKTDTLFAPNLKQQHHFYILSSFLHHFYGEYLYYILLPLAKLKFFFSFIFIYFRYFQYAIVLLTELINANALFLAINLSIVPFWFNFVHSKFYRWTQMVLLICKPVKKNIICIWCKVLIKVQ